MVLFSVEMRGKCIHQPVVRQWMCHAINATSVDSIGGDIDEGASCCRLDSSATEVIRGWNERDPLDGFFIARGFEVD